MRPIAALFVEADGCYATSVGVDLWPEQRDARKYTGNAPVVAHPPCTRWCRLAGLVEARWGYKRGEDGGCFASALAHVRRVGGVLEHPAYSAAWKAFDLPMPKRGEGWVQGACGGWSCQVQQSNYGHRARKNTWLYAYGFTPPELDWSDNMQGLSDVSWCGNKVKSGNKRPRLSASERIATPPAFRDLLIGMVRSARLMQEATR